MTTTNERAQIIQALRTWINQRPGLDYGNYGDPVSYRAEMRSITKHLHHARALLRYVEMRESITADMLKAAFKGAFSERLQWQEEYRCEECDAIFWSDNNRSPGTTGACRCNEIGRAPHRIPTGRGRLDYCTGQYWPTEYRRAACAVLASAIWYWWREECMPEPTTVDDGNKRYDNLSAGDFLRRNARREFGRGIQSRWFN
ncbi:MAG TPA: hypothetical protein VGN16_09710 [Acidobacteriaceae bacterium]|jgi:hypothetical protein